MPSPITNPESWQFEIKNLQAADGDDGLRFQASLYLNGKRIAIASNNGDGGNHRLKFIKPEYRQTLQQYVDHLKTVTLQPMKNWMHYYLQDFLAEMSSYGTRAWTKADIDQDMVIDSLCNAAEWRKKLKSKRYAKRTVIANLSDSQGYTFNIEYESTKVEPIRQEMARSLSTDADKIVIFNELLLTPKSPQESK